MQLGVDPEMIDEHEVHTYNISIDELIYCIAHDNNTYPKDSFLYKKELDLKLQPNKLNSLMKYFLIFVI